MDHNIIQKINEKIWGQEEEPKKIEQKEDLVPIDSTKVTNALLAKSIQGNREFAQRAEELLNKMLTQLKALSYYTTPSAGVEASHETDIGASFIRESTTIIKDMKKSGLEDEALLFQEMISYFETVPEVDIDILREAISDTSVLMTNRTLIKE